MRAEEGHSQANPNLTVHALCSTVRDVFGAERVRVWSLDGDGEHLSLAGEAPAAEGAVIGDGGRQIAPRIAVDSVPGGRSLLQTRGHSTISVLPKWPAVEIDLRKEGEDDVVAAEPGVFAGSVFATGLWDHGAVGVLSVEPAECVVAEELESVLTLIASSIHRDRATTRRGRRVELAEILLELADQRLAGLGLEGTLDLACSLLVEALHARAGTVVLLRPHGAIGHPGTQALPGGLSDKHPLDLPPPLGAAPSGQDQPLTPPSEPTSEDSRPAASRGRIGLGERDASDPDSSPGEWEGDRGAWVITEAELDDQVARADVLAVPISSSGTTSGLFLIELGERGELDEDEVWLAHQVGIHLAQVVFDTEAANISDVRFRRVSAINELLGEASQVLSVSEALRTVMRVMCDALSASVGVAWLMGEDGRVRMLLSDSGSEEAVRSLERQALGRPARELPLWVALGSNPPPPPAVALSSGPSQMSMTANVFGLGSWAAVGLWVNEEMRAAVVCGDATPDKVWKPEEVDMLRHLALEGSLILAHAQLRENEALKLSELSHRAMHDTLTGLANRDLFTEVLTRALARTSKDALSTAVLFIDLDRFKLINDHLGHAAGDALLLEAAKRLQRSVRPQDTVARWAGDEFTVLIEHIVNSSDAVRAAERILEELREPYILNSKAVRTTCSIGIATTSTPVAPAELIRYADMAMYAAKKKGRNRWALSGDPHTQVESRRRVDHHKELANAIEDRQIEVWLQPTVRTPGGDHTGWEALARWRHPRRGLLCATDFVPSVEDSPLASTLDWVVLETVIGLLGRWELRWPNQVPAISVNVCPGLLRHRSTAERIADLIRHHNVHAYQLSVEISEAAFSDKTNASWGALDVFREHGIRYSLDHVGAGFTMLPRLVQCSFALMKTDPSMISGANAADVGILLRTENAIATTIGAALCVTGVETADQHAAVEQAGIGLCQGKLFGAPMPVRDIESGLVAALG